MIEKLKPNEDKVFKTETGEYLTIPELGVPKPISDKINELVDAVNELQKHEEQHLDLLTQLNEMRLQNTKKAEPAENVQKIDIGELAYLQKENSDLKDEVEKLQKQLAEWQNANVSLIKDSAICNTYTHIRWDELCRLREIADKYAEITGHKGGDNE